MDLFDKKLSLSEALHYSSILDGNGIDTDVLMVYNSMQVPMWNPMMKDPETHLLNNQNFQNAQKRFLSEH